MREWNAIARGEVGPGGVGPGEVGPGGVGPDGIGRGEVGPGSVGPGGIGSDAVGSDAVGSDAVGLSQLGHGPTGSRIDLTHGVDTDLDGLPDTVVVPDPLDLVIAADTDRDGLADLLIRFGADGRGDVVDLGGDLGALPSSVWGTDPGSGGDWGWCTDAG